MESASFTASAHRKPQYSGNSIFNQNGGNGNNRPGPPRPYEDNKRNFNSNVGNSNSYNCTFCKKPGSTHTIEKCYKLHGYPPHSKFNNNRLGNFQNQHMVQGNSVSTADNYYIGYGNQVVDFPSTKGTQTQVSSSNTMGLSLKQYSQLMDMLQQVKLGQQTVSSLEVNVTTNCVGPFTEEASGSW
ncbi:uncharacterized protein LOC132068369 [Lycium ferocissimum]|uniref:uncharacterized protein LOC132068369 n=1 Tax=Lycium ferocissimum TaxID=112874 RepID=UPI0028168223|nr:uncharacterized protein LOC132068369 [Lycium ferocissimum]